MTTLPNMSIVLPTLDGDIGAWDDKLNAALSLIDPHDHTAGKGVQVPTAGINIDADLGFGSWHITALGALAFNAVAALASGSKSLFVSSADNELYWRTNGGTNVKLTDGNSINTSLVGGILGDYTSVGAELSYDDANDVYTFKQEGSNPWARIASGPVRIYEYNTTETVYVELAVAAALASSYTITLPAALPGAAAIMQISAAGVVSFSNTTTEDIVAADFRFTGDQTLMFSGGAYEDVAGSHTKYNSAAGAHIGWTLANTADKLSLPLPVREGDVITGFTTYFDKGASTDTVHARLWATRMFGTVIETAQTADATQSGTGLQTASSGAVTVTVTAGWQYYMVVYTSFVGGSDVLLGTSINITRP